jgi:hypothetical protein
MRTPIATAVILTSLVGGCTHYVAAPATTTAATAYAEPQPAWTNPATFADRVRTRMDRIDNRVRTRTTEGTVASQALNELAVQRSQVEQYLSQASVDGVISPLERDQIRNMVRDMSQIETRWQVPGQIYGGGPTYTPDSNADSNDSWWNY